MKCPQCGAELPENTLFCTECGTRIENAPAPAEVKEAAAAGAAAPELNVPPVYTPQEPAAASEPDKKKAKKERGKAAPEKPAGPAPADAAEKPAADKPAVDKTKTLSTAAYFWLIVLFCFPVIGLIAMILMSSISKNKNLANFARGCLIFFLVILGISVIASLLGYILFRGQVAEWIGWFAGWFAGVVAK